MNDFELEVLYNEYQGYPTLSIGQPITAQTALGSGTPYIIGSLNVTGQNIPKNAPTDVPSPLTTQINNEGIDVSPGYVGYSAKYPYFLSRVVC